MGAFRPIKGSPPEVCWHAPAALNIDAQYQRSIDSSASQRLIQQIAENWDWRLCAPLTVSHRADTTGAMAFFVIDGQHRLEAAKLRGDIDQLPCIVSRFETYEDEALAFVAINSARRAVTALDRFHARIAANEKAALATRDAIEAAGLTLTRQNDAAQWKAREVAFPDFIMRHMARDKAATSAALAMLARTYPVAPLLRGKDLFGGLWTIFHDAGEQPDAVLERLSLHLRDKLQAEWVQLRNRHMTESSLEADRAMAFVMRRGFHAMAKPYPAGAKPAAAPPPPMPRADTGAAAPDTKKPAVSASAIAGLSSRTPATPPAHFKPDADGKSWCDQCEQRKTMLGAANCASKFCKLK